MSGDDADHMIAMRLKIGEIVTISNQDGNVAQVKIVAFDKRNRFVRYDIISNHQQNQSHNLSVFQAILDKQYMDKCVEIMTISPITDIYFFLSDYSVERQLNPIRYERIITRSCEQSESPFRPRVHYITFEEMLKKVNSKKAICTHTYSENKDVTTVISQVNQILVGPEGGWSQEEILCFENLKIPFVSLGERIYPGWLAGFATVKKYFPQLD